MMLDFNAVPKMARLSRTAIITEKLDGTNAQILITSVQNEIAESNKNIIASWKNGEETKVMLAGSRQRWITPDNDNFGFAKWVEDNAEELSKLGNGRHYGEWWGQGIQRKYNMKECVFSLFNAIRWCAYDAEPKQIVTADPRISKMQENAPECCRIVPILYDGVFSTDAVDWVLSALKKHGSSAAPGFMNPEGVVIFHEAGNVGFKKTIDHDELPKSCKS
jgi:hypothetical protein